jgi:hypothetical protein
MCGSWGAEPFNGVKGPLITTQRDIEEILGRASPRNEASELGKRPCIRLPGSQSSELVVSAMTY